MRAVGSLVANVMKCGSTTSEANANEPAHHRRDCGDRRGCMKKESLELEPMLSPEQLAELWSVHRTTILRLFKEEPGVMKISSVPGKIRKRSTMRIPVSVAERVRRQHEVI